MKRWANTKSKTAFTLAEVLITLAVIGVVAAMTIPTLIKNYEKQQYFSAFKETYAVLHQASAQLLTDNAGDLTGVYTTTDAMMNAYATKLKIHKTCTAATAVGNCWSTNTKNLSGSGTVAMSSASPAVVLANGAFLNIDNTGGWYDPNCDLPWYYDKPQSPICWMLNVDTNGLRGPNRMGRDIFQFYQPKNIPLVPNGYPGTDDDYRLDTNYCDPNSTNYWNGVGCGGRILYENGMNY